MTTLREAAQQAREALEYAQQGRECPSTTRQAITALRAALAQQDEPVLVQGELPPRYVARSPIQAEPAQDRHRACPTHCCPVHGCKYGHDDCPVAAGAVQPVYPRNNGCESCADEAEPLNLSDRAVQRRLAAQWGYVPAAAQAEPAQEPVGWNWMLDGQPYGQAYYGNPPDTDIAERAATAGRTVRLLYTAPPPPQRKPLTEEEIMHIGMTHQSLRQVVRAVERAHGIKE